MNTASEDAPQLVPAPENLSGGVSPEVRPTEREVVEIIDQTGRRAPVVFLDHIGARFLFSFERCQQWNDFKYLVGEVYAHATEEARGEISKEEFDILTSDDEHVLPTVWEDVIGGLPLYKRGDSSYTVRIKFRVSALSTNSRRPPGPGNFYGPIRETDWTPADPSLVKDRREERISRVDFRRDAPRTVRRLSDEGDRREAHRRASRSRSRSTSSRLRLLSPIVEPRPENEDEDDDDSDEESVALTEDEDVAEPVTVLPPPRTFITPVDRDGNPLSFVVDTNRPLHPHQSSSTNHINGTKGDEKSHPRNVRNMEAENLKILKAVSVTSESRTTIELHGFPGPEGSSMTDGINMRWYHLHGDQLDFAQFKDACLGVQGLDERLRRLITKTLAKIEKEKLKPFQDGLFIEPGTVLRGDEKQQADPYSVIFSCVPYFDVNSPLKPGLGKSDRLHPPRSLMQSYYPYEPVRERDEEQAFTKSANGTPNKIIQVPSMWMMTIGTHAVVTCGYRPLSSDFVKSIKVVSEDLKALGLRDGHTLLNIRLTDWEGRVLLYSPAECKSYFEMEQKLRELRLFASGAPATASLQLAWNTHEGKKKVTPGNWLSIFESRTDIFVNLSIINQNEAREIVKKVDSEKSEQVGTTDSSLKLIPPFLRWPVPTRIDLKLGDATVAGAAKLDTQLRPVQDIPEQNKLISPEIRRSMQCLEHVEKAMLTETIYEYDAQHVVDKTFTSTQYYQSLPEETFEDVKSSFVSLMQSSASGGVGPSGRTTHHIITDTQCSQITMKTGELVETVHATLKLFVSDVDNNTLLRKVWGAMKALGTIVGQVGKRCSQKAVPNEYTDPEWKATQTGNRKWTVRPATTAPELGFIPTPNSDPDQKFIQSIKRCKCCRRGQVYTTPQDALDHLQLHLQTGVTKRPDLRNWIRSDEQKMVEDINAGYLLIINQTREAVQSLFFETRQLVEGVQIEEGKMSDIYTLPHELLTTLRRLIVFYFAIERAFHHTELSFDKRDEVVEEEDAPFSNMGLEVLSRFCESAKTSLNVARMELCVMTSASVPEDFFKRLSLGPEYLCSWFIRRLMVKPLNDSMTAADIYREYLSTLQFQVNHRPGKRLLRSINLLQEELAALEQVNAWQTNLIDSYTRVLDDSTYPIELPSRRAFFQYERLLLDSCIDNLSDARDDYRELIRRCGPLSESTKQSAEINEEDHGKAIFVFTVVTVIFMPLSFVTSYLGMNTADIRDMENKQSLFWAIALPLTAVTMGSILYVAYYSDELRDTFSSLYRRLTGKQDTSTATRGISVAQRNRAWKIPINSSSTVDYKSLADEAEFAPPRRIVFGQRFDYAKQADYLDEWDVKPATIAYDFAQPKSKMLVEERSGGRMKMGLQATTYSMPEPYAGPEFGKTRPYGRSQPPPPPPPRLAYNDSRPTYMRVARKFVDVGTLAHFDIPWEIDSADPDYFLLLRYMDESETDMLFEHTRRARGQTSGAPRLNIRNRMGGDMLEYGREKPKGYEWVRKSRKSRPYGREREFVSGRRMPTFNE